MGLIRVVWGSATAPTELAAYDAALAAANVHDYNLVTVSSVIPANATVEVVGTAPDLGPVGERLTVVQSRATAGPLGASSVDDVPVDGGPVDASPVDDVPVDGGPVDASQVDAGPAIAGLGWSLASGGAGIFYEAAGTDRETVERTIDDGLAAGRSLRDWDWSDGGRQFASAEPGGGDASGARTGEGGSAGAYACAVVLALYGESTPIV